jgi:beta-1,4-mannosyl-glycoprotein beta-1,4-N-acetylglucosaminyltransferase
MKIFDCFMFYDEELLLDIRMNILDKFVDYFVIVESKYFHNGKERDLRFDISKYSSFKNKIIYVIQDEKPKGIQVINSSDNEGIKSDKMILNAHLQENSQRNLIQNGLNKSDDNDMILVSDVDEIPNLEKNDLKAIKNKIILFEQNIFYYKLNRYLPDFKWYGTKACKKKYLKSPQWLRNIKNKDYAFLRIDTFFSKSKYIDKYFIKDGGWHFSNLKNFKDIEVKLKSYLHHRDYEVEELGINKIKKLIEENKTIYNMYVDKTKKKYSDDSRMNLEKFEINKLPLYIQNNLNKFKDWID